MKLFPLIGFMAMCGCCDNTADPADLQYPAIQLNFDYHYNGFSIEDTLFKVTNVEYGGQYSSSGIYSPLKLNDSVRYFLIMNMNCEKTFIESTVTGFIDTISNIGYNCETVKSGNLFCDDSKTSYFNVHAIHRGQYVNSGQSPNLYIHVIK